MPKKAVVKYRSLRSHLIHLPLSLYASLVQQQARPQGLVLHLAPLTSSSRAIPKTAYLGWTGLASASSLAGVGPGVEGETVEIDPEVAVDLNWAEGTIVEISVIHNPTKAKSVSLTPMTSDDWEILEQHANFLENNLLGQLRAAQKGQELDIWVAGKSKIRVRVDETNPSTAVGGGAAVLVTGDTEVFVAPRPRGSARKEEKHKGEGEGDVLVNGHSSLVGLVKDGDSKKKEKSVGLRLIPPKIARGWKERILSEDEASLLGSDRVFLCAYETIHRLRHRLKIPLEKGKGLHMKLKRTGEANEPEGKHGGDGDGGGSEWSADLAGSRSDHEDTPHIGVLEGVVLEWDEMPAGAISIPGEVDAGWVDWGKVQVSAAEHHQKGRTKRKGRSRDDLRLSFPGGAVEDAGEQLVGVDELLQSATAQIRRTFGFAGIKPILLVGAKGNGKTTLAKAIGRSLEVDKDILAETMYVDVGRMDAEGRSEGLKAKMTAWMEEAKDKSPCCLILDGLDVLLSPENEFTPSSVPAVLAEHFSRLMSSLPLGVMVIATASSVVNLHPSLNANHTFGESIKLPVPSKETRQELLAHRLSSSSTSNSTSSAASHSVSLDYVSLANMTEGYSYADIIALIENASQQALIRSAKSQEVNGKVEMGDFEEAQAAFTPVSLRGVSLQKSEVKWADIGGLREPRKLLRETLEWPTKYAQIFKNCPLRLRSGLLLYGYPGCGKTLLASAVAKECGLNFISVKGPEILNKYIGASEQAVRTLFERASAAKPCVLFFDEFDSIAPRRGHDSTGVTDRVVNQMLTEMDGAEGLEGVYVLAATSRPDLIDPALLRPGRLDKSIICDMPDFPSRLEILQALAQKLVLGDDVDLEQVAQGSEGMSGADLQAVLYNAHLEVVHSSLAHETGEVNSASLGAKGKGKGKAKAAAAGTNGDPTPNGVPPEQKGSGGYRQLAPPGDFPPDRTIANKITGLVIQDDTASSGQPAKQIAPQPIIQQTHLLKSLANTRPSVSAQDRYRLQGIYDSFVSDRDGGMSNGDLGRGTGTRISLK